VWYQSVVPGTVLEKEFPARAVQREFTYALPADVRAGEPFKVDCPEEVRKTPKPALMLHLSSSTSLSSCCDAST
jgi:hypothetical protein